MIFGIIALVIVGCGGGGDDSNSTSTSSSNSSSTTTTPPPSVQTIINDGTACAPMGATVLVSGTVHYERVFFSTTASGLDYNNIQPRPVRGAVIQALGVGGCVMASALTSVTGTYSLAVSPNTSVKIRVKAQTQSTAGALWDFAVKDNTNSNGLYVLDGSFATSGIANSTRNLTATSGWTGSSYGGVRSAAPFAILDSVYKAIQKVVSVDASVNMDNADIFWSVNNSTASGTPSAGEIGTSYYLNDEIYLLGRQNSGTDEYDEHVIIHEWGHYFEDNLSRSDSIGGGHTISDILDMRVALSEGFGNALSGMVTDDPVYRDSYDAQQGNGSVINVETNAATNIGWFSEGSVQTILYDIYDTTADVNDSVSLGFSAIYNAMVSSEYKNQASLTSIFSLIDKVKEDNVGSASAIDTLVSSQSIDVIVDRFGTNETNSGGNATNLPMYKLLTDDGNPVIVCSHKDNGEYNKLGNGQFLRLQVVSAGSHNIVATRVSGLTSSDPDVGVYLNGSLIFVGTSSTNNTETITANLNVDEYIVEVHDFSNVDRSTTTGGNVCFNVSVF